MAAVDTPLVWPLVSNLENRSEDSSKDARMVNCYAELDPKDGQYFIIKRPGYSSTSIGTSGAGNGTFNWKQNIYSIFGTTILKSNIVLGAVDGLGGIYRFALTGGSSPKLVLGNGSKAYFTNGVTLTQIVDGDFPSAFAKGWAYLDGTLYVMRLDGGIQGSDIDDPSVWNPLNLIFARAESGDGVALAKQGSYVVALKEFSTEIFWDVGNAVGSPLGPVPGAQFNYGCAHAGSLRDIDGTLIWVSNNRSASLQIVRMDNLSLQIISTPAVERLLEGKANFIMKATILKHAGHRWYVLNIATMEFTLIYDLDQNLWYQWQGPDGLHWPIVDQTFDTVGNHLIQHETDGKLYILKAHYQRSNDNGVVFPLDIYTQNFDAGGLDRRKVLTVMRFNADQVPGSVLQVRCSDDDYQIWSNFRDVNLSEQRPVLTDCGTFYRRALHLRHFRDTPFRMKSIALQLDRGTL